jgi:lipopolysaccharide biosynthesis protein
MSLHSTTQTQGGTQADASPGARLIAFYLPQFHPIPENDLWWGKGFTEWTNVTTAKPLFPGHYQPNLPSDLGFYDLRVPEVREAQANLAHSYGIEGFCYWHYWLGNGKRLLDRVFSDVLESGKPEFPFCLAWANHDWNRGWHGQKHHVLIEQKYPGEVDHRNHFNFLLRAFLDPRYIRVDGKPMFIIFRPEELPNSKEVIGLWKRLALEAGLPGLFVPGISEMEQDLDKYGCDAHIPGEPGIFFRLKPGKSAFVRQDSQKFNLVKRYWRKVRSRMPFPLRASYQKKAQLYINHPSCSLKTLPCVLPNWDNTPRSGKLGTVFPDANPETYRLVLRKAIADVSGRPFQQRLVFIKSWNEWAEGNYLEPGRRFGHDFLRVTKEEVFGR